MVDTKKLIEEIDEDINKAEWQIKTAREMDSKDVECRFLERKSNLTKIKEILEDKEAGDFAEELVEVLPPEPDEELISVCCKARIQIDKVETKKGSYYIQACSKCRKEIIEVPQPANEELVNRGLRMTDRAIQLNEIDIGKIGLTPELGDNLKALKLIRTLLQSQPKPRITRGEIEDLFTPQSFVSRREVERWLKSKNIEVVEK